jgi:hypothetical protein
METLTSNAIAGFLANLTRHYRASSMKEKLIQYRPAKIMNGEGCKDYYHISNG